MGKENLHIFRGELALALAVIINSFGVVLMLYSGAGISAISSVPYAFSEVIPKVSLGTWTYIFQGLLVLSLMILRKKFVPQYLFSFVVGFIFSELLDVHKMWIDVLPTDLGWCVLYFAVSYFLLCIGIALDVYKRQELAELKGEDKQKYLDIYESQKKLVNEKAWDGNCLLYTSRCV